MSPCHVLDRDEMDATVEPSHDDKERAGFFADGRGRWERRKWRLLLPGASEPRLKVLPLRA
jgi:hypothetical protein